MFKRADISRRSFLRSSVGVAAARELHEQPALWASLRTILWVIATNSCEAMCVKVRPVFRCG